MTNKDLKYPEMQEYDWAKDFERVRKNSKFVSGSIHSSDIPKRPLKEQLAIIRETMERAEVMEAFASAPYEEPLSERARHLLMWYHQYLGHKYGNRPDPLSLHTNIMRRFALGEFSGVDDPKLHEALLASRYVCLGDE